MPLTLPQAIIISSHAQKRSRLFLNYYNLTSTILLQTILTRMTKEQLIANYMRIIKPLSYSWFKFKLLTFSLLKISSLLVSMTPHYPCSLCTMAHSLSFSVSKLKC